DFVSYSFRAGFTLIGALSLDAHELSCASRKAPVAFGAVRGSVFKSTRALEVHDHLVPVGQGAHDVAMVTGARAAHLCSGGHDVVFRLGTGDIHRLGPSALALTDFESMVGSVSHLNHVLGVGFGEIGRAHV